ncbi:hypothetical protein [Nitrosopumilus adriaticus]|uniref:hypothetical protein n=1 Tax=Nitrosopumilus adriaticus TaxID=1580092 RepID=UPI00352ECA1C
MKTRHYITIGIVIAVSITFFVLGPSQGHIAEYFLTDEQFEKVILGDTSHVSDFRDTQNPNECWYQEDDGSFTPCKIDDGGSMMFGMFLVVFWPWIILGISIVIIFIIWRKRK